LKRTEKFILEAEFASIHFIDRSRTPVFPRIPLQYTEYRNNSCWFFITTGIFILSHVVSSDVGRKISQPRARVEHVHAWIGTWSVLTKTVTHGDTSCKAHVLCRQWRRHRRTSDSPFMSVRISTRISIKWVLPAIMSRSAGYASTPLCALVSLQILPSNLVSLI